MQRLVDKAQFELQNLERSLCAALNTLALVLVESATGRGAADEAGPCSPEGEARAEARREAGPGPGPGPGTLAGDTSAPKPSGPGDAAAKPGAADGRAAFGATLKRKRSASGRLGVEAARKEAIRLLEQSFRQDELFGGEDLRPGSYEARVG